MFDGMIAKVAMVTVFKSPLHTNAPTARVQTWLKMFLMHNVLEGKVGLQNSPWQGGGDKLVSGSGTNSHFNCNQYIY